MAVPSVLTDLSVSEGSNNPLDSETITASTRPSDYLRALGALLRREQAQFTAVASASSIDLGAITTGNYGHVTGTTTITSFGTVAAGIERTLVFDGILTLTHNATSLILATGANRTTAAGDVGVYVSEGSGNWREKAYHAIGSYQPLDAQLTTLSGITAQQATDLSAVSTFIGTLLDDADAATAQATLGVDDLIVSATTETPDTAEDYFLFEDATDNTQKKALLSAIAGTLTAGAAGSFVHPSGLIINWGATSIPSTGASATFTTAFSTACYGITFGLSGVGASGTVPGYSATTTTATFTNSGADATRTWFWLAVGV